jgi:hypothetical protein
VGHLHHFKAPVLFLQAVVEVVEIRIKLVQTVVLAVEVLKIRTIREQETRLVQRQAKAIAVATEVQGLEAAERVAVVVLVLLAAMQVQAHLGTVVQVQHRR